MTSDLEAPELSPPAHPGVAVTVRPVASVEELLQLEHVIATQFPARRSVAARARERESHFEEQRSLMVLAEQNGAIVGGALAFRTADSVQVDGIALAPGVRGLGIGRKLMAAIESEAIRLGAQSIYLGGANTENRGFYWRLGFAGRGSLMHKGLPLAGRFIAERRKRAAGHDGVA